MLIFTRLIFTRLIFAMLIFTMLILAMLIFTMLIFAMLIFAMLIFAMLIFAMLIFAMLIFAMLIFAMLILAANFYNANLYNVIINWNSHDLLAEILRQNAVNDKQRMLAGFSIMSRNLCWKELFSTKAAILSEKKWVIEVFKKYETEGNRIPLILEN